MAATRFARLGATGSGQSEALLFPLLMEAFGHATQRQTLAYLGIQSDEIAQIYELEL